MFFIFSDLYALNIPNNNNKQVMVTDIGNINFLFSCLSDTSELSKTYASSDKVSSLPDTNTLPVVIGSLIVYSVIIVPL